VICSWQCWFSSNVYKIVVRKDADTTYQQALDTLEDIPNYSNLFISLDLVPWFFQSHEINSCCLTPPTYSLSIYDPIHATWDFSLVMCLVMVLWLTTNDATTKPRTSYGLQPHGSAAQHALVSWFLIMIHCRVTPMCYLLVIFSLIYTSMFGKKIYISDQM